MIWGVTAWLPRDISLETFSEHCELTNGIEIFTARFPPTDSATFPAAQLKLTLESFDLDCFSLEGKTFVSDRMVEAMALPSGCAQYFAVDASQSSPLPRAKGYRIMHVAAVEAVADPTRSDYLEAEAKPGTVRPPFVIATKIAIRPDAAPAHDMFRDSFFTGYVFCTDALAMRVLEAGCTGMRFFDPMQGLGSKMHIRTLQGIEETGIWDARRRAVRTKLLRGIH